MNVRGSLRMRAWWAGTSILAAACMALPAFAEDSGSAQAATGEIFRWLNFILVFGGAAFLIAKYSGGFFRANAQAIAADIRESSAAKAAAERELQGAESKLSGLSEEVALLRRQAESDTAAETARLRASGIAEIEKINQAAQAELSATQRVAQQELRALAASIAVDRAAALLKVELTQEARARIFREFLVQIGRGEPQRSMN